MSTTDILRTALAELAANLDALTFVTRSIKDRRAEFDAQHADLLDSAKKIASAVDASEAQVRALTLVVFEQTGEKKAVDGASVVIRVAHTYDKGAALAWAKEHMPQLVTETLDVKAFDKIAAAGGFAGAQKVETPAVTIATDLSAYLAIPEPTRVN